MQPLIRKLWLLTFGVAISILIAIGLFPLGSYPLLGLAGLAWLVIGGIITISCLVWAYHKRWWRAFALHFSNVILALLSFFVGVSELGATDGESYLSPSGYYIATVNGLGDSGTSPYNVQIKWTFVPFFSLFGREIFLGDCGSFFRVKWRSDVLLHISCANSANIRLKRSEALGVSIEYELSAREQSKRADN